MTATGPLIIKLLASSVSVANRAGKIVRDVMSKGDLGIVEKGKDDYQTEADRSAQRCIVASLSAQYPKINIIGEEDNPNNEGEIANDWIVLEADKEVLALQCPEALQGVKEEDIVVWVDPLDGTSEYTQGALMLKRDPWERWKMYMSHPFISMKWYLSLLQANFGFLEHVTVLIGISVNEKPVAGVIHQPYYKRNGANVIGRTIWGLQGAGVGGFTLAPPPDSLIITTTRSHSNSVVEKALQVMNASQILRVGGAGFKVIQLLEGQASVYVFASAGCKKWDTCAPAPTARGAPYPPSPHSHPPTPTWTVDGFHHFHSASAAAAQPNSVTLSPAPSVDSSGSPQRGETMSYAPAFAPPVPTAVQAASSGSNHSDSDEEQQFAPPPRSPKDAPLNSPAPQMHSAQQNPHYRAQHREFFPNDMPESNTNGRLLWDFLQQLLNDATQRYTNYIAWKNRETGVFKIVDPAGLAKLWGIQKNHLSMNYDKMSRALRYYYRVNILRKVQGERHCYQFLRNPTELKNIKNISLLRQQMSPTRVAPQQVVKTEMKEERCEDENIDEDMPTDLSMAASEPWRKRARSELAPTPQHDKHRISALIGDSMMMKREPDYVTDHYALNLKSENCEQ